jgi:cysteine-rich repeat protein
MPFDGFETGDLSLLPWTAGSGTDGFAVLSAAAAARSGSHGLASQNEGRASTTAWIELPLTVMEDGEVCFWYVGESEGCCDHFRFLVDGVEQISDSGTVPWTLACSPVTAGSRTFRWEYSKDFSVDSGADRFAIDDVLLPMTAEACDDGNVDDGDGCSSTCLVE